jgi:hypothetical protein
MRKARTLLIGLMLWACTTSSAAHAGSLFELGEERPVSAAVRLDFTIVIPQIITLSIDANALDPTSSPRALTVFDHTPSEHLPSPGGSSGLSASWLSVQVSSNAGTVAIGRPVGSASEPGVPLDTHSAIFLVALP